MSVVLFCSCMCVFKFGYPDSSLMQRNNELLSWSCETFSSKDPKSCSSTYAVKGDINAQRLDLPLQPLAAHFATEARSVR